MYRVAIVGRPNVGKSTLFNRLTQTRKAIVGDEPGITRDRLYQLAEWDQKRFEVIDTGGLIPHEREPIAEKVLQQAEVAIEEADLILFIVDVRDGVTPLDERVNSFLRSHGKDYFLIVNKVDVPRLEDEVLQFYRFGAPEMFAVSAEHKEGISELLEAILARVGETEEKTPEKEIPVAIIGRPNVGKSSLLNRMLGQERAIVTDVPGTTRDAIDTLYSLRGRFYRLVDTAGIRRKGKTKLMAEKLSVVMARKSIERAEVVVLAIDATEGATKLDATIGGYAHKAGKSIIVVVNKWDVIVEAHPKESALLQNRRLFEKELRMNMRFLDYVPLIFVSAKTGYHVAQIFDLVNRAYDARHIRIPTAELNQFLKQELEPALLAPGSTRKFPVLYAAQVGVAPPNFVFFTRGRRQLHFSTQRFIVNKLREKYGFYATPLRVTQRARERTLASRGSS